MTIETVSQRHGVTRVRASLVDQVQDPVFHLKTTKGETKLWIGEACPYQALC